MEDAKPHRAPCWIEVGYGDLWEDCSETFRSTKQNGPVQNNPRNHAPSARLLERRLRRAVTRGDVDRVAELLRRGCGYGEGDLEWPSKTLRNALKYAPDAATIAAFASGQPKFFHGEDGASAAIFFALKSGNEETVRLLLAAGVPPDAESHIARGGARPLHWACAWGRPNAIRALLEAGADVMARTERGLTPLHIAANVAHSSCVEVLLQAGAAVDAVDAEGSTALHHAAGCGRHACLSALIDAGAAIDARCFRGRSPLHLIAQGYSDLHLPSHLHGRTGDPEYDDDYEKCCVLLLSHGADMHAVDERGVSVLRSAMLRRHCAVILALATAGANIAVRLDNGETALHAVAAAPIGRTESVIKSLVTLGLDVNARANDGCTPLHRAVGQWRIETVRILLHLNADMTLESSIGDPPLFFAATLGFTEGVQAMLEAGADIRMRASDGRTLLHAAAASTRDMIEELVAAGVDPNARANDGRTPLHCASGGWNSAECLDYLVELGADLQARDNRGWTAAHFAASLGSTEALRWLAARTDLDATLHDALGVSTRTSDGTTPLHLAAASGESYVVHFLLGMGASVADTDMEGRTVLHTAACGTCEETLRVLLESGRGGDRLRGIRDTNGDTAAELAHVGSLRRLLEWWSLAG